MAWEARSGFLRKCGAWGEKRQKATGKVALKTFLESKQALLQEQTHQLGALLLWRCCLQRDRIAQGLELTNSTRAHPFLIQRLKVGRAEIAVFLLVTQQVVDDHEHTM